MSESKSKTDSVETVEKVDVNLDYLREKGYKNISFSDMVAYIDNYALDKKEWFKHVVESTRLLKDEKDEETGEVKKVLGGYNHLATKKSFCKEFIPDIIPVAKPKRESVLDFIKNW